MNLESSRVACVRILCLEDDCADAHLTQLALQKEWPHARIDRVETRDAFVAALDGGSFDLVLSDYTIPGFNGLDALDIVRERKPGLPYIFFSGTIGEERAVEALKRGATDYVLKDRPARLIPAVRRALTEARENDRRPATDTQLPPPTQFDGLATLAGRVAHHINNALAPILLALPLIRRKAADLEMQGLLNVIELGTEKCADLMRQLQGFARDGRGDFLDLRRQHPAVGDRATETVPPRGASSAGRFGGGGSSRGAILVIDDEDPIGQMVKALLQADGYRVILASNGVDGVAAYRARPHEIVGVLTDINMPVMHGAEVIRELRVVDPDARIVVMSGQEAPPGMREEPGRLVFIRKPMTHAELSAAIQKIARV